MTVASDVSGSVQHQAPPCAARVGRRARRAIIPASYLGLTVLWMAHVWSGPGTAVAGLPGYEDNLQLLWYVAWWPYAMTHLGNPLFTNLVNYPTGVNLAWMGTGAPLLGLIGAPVTAEWGPVAGYNTLLTVGLAGSAWAVYLAVRPWVHRTLPAFLAGALFLFSPYIDGQSAGHIDLAVVPIVPLVMLWARWAIIERRGSDRAAGLVLGVLLSAEFFISEEIAASLLLMLVLAACTMAVAFPTAFYTRVGRVAHIVVWCCAFTMLVLAVPLVWQYGGPGRISGPLMVPSQFSGRFLAFFVPAATQLISPAASARLIEVHGYNVVEYGNYVGLPLLAVISTLAVSRWRLPVVRVGVVMFLLTGVCILGANFHLVGSGPRGFPLPWALIGRIPPLGDLLPVRLSLYLDLFAVFLLGIALDQILMTSRRPWSLLVAVLVFAAWLPMPLTMAVDAYPVPKYFAHPVNPAGQVLLVVPFPQSVREANAMEWQATADMTFSMVGGYYTRTTGTFGPFYHGPPLNLFTWDLWTLEQGGRGPGTPIDRKFGFTPIAHWFGSPNKVVVRAQPYVSQTLRHFVIAYLTDHRVGAVVLGPATHHGALERFLLELFGPPRHTAGVLIWRRPVHGWSAFRVNT